jgi:tetratricopeptide (TPR) repeat protein
MKHIRHSGSSPAVIALVGLLGGSILWGGSAELDMAHKFYNATNFEESLKVLDSIQEKDAAVFELRGLNHYMRGDYKKAVEALEAALKYEPRNSMITLWLGRAYGRWAETSSPFTAIGHASRARQNFERATELDPHNLEALSDLFEYYMDAPGFLGGGMDKAEKQIARIAAVDGAEAEWAQAKLAEKRKQNRGVEAHLRQAIKVAPRRIGLRLELARFLSHESRFQEAEESFAQADRIEPGCPRVAFARAETYIKYSRNLQVAKQILQQYMSLALTPDDPPRAEAAKLLRQVEGS